MVEAAPDAIVGGPELQLRSLQAATRSIPLIGMNEDMVGTGMVASLARPGGNTTGISLLSPELDGKRQDILLEAVPGARRIAALQDTNVSTTRQLQSMQEAARSRNVELSVFTVATPEDVAPAIEAAKAAGAQALNFLASGLFFPVSRVAIERSAALRLPAIHHWPEAAEAEGVLAYGSRFTQVWRQRARLVPGYCAAPNPPIFRLSSRLISGGDQSQGREGVGHGSSRARIARGQGDRMSSRRELILLGGAAVWPIAARAQQPAIPVVGFIHGGAANAFPGRIAAFRVGLAETGYVEGQNVVIEYHWLEGRFERLPAVLADLIRRRVAVIATPGSTPAAIAAKSATSTIPIVFGVSEDPVALGIVASLARPGGNATGINFFVGEIDAKRFGLMHELLPKATRFAVLVNPADATARAATSKALMDAARTLGLDVVFFNASTPDEIDVAFAALRVNGPMPFSSLWEFRQPRRRFATLAARSDACSFATREMVGPAADELWRQLCRHFSSGRVCRVSSRAARRFAGRAADQVRIAINEDGKALGSTCRRCCSRADEVIE